MCIYIYIYIPFVPFRVPSHVRQDAVLQPVGLRGAGPFCTVLHCTERCYRRKPALDKKKTSDKKKTTLEENLR